MVSPCYQNYQQLLDGITIDSFNQSQMNFKYQYLRSLCLVAFLLTVAVANQCGRTDDEFFITFHPHLDAFWLNTDDQLKDINFRPEGFLYAMNQRNSKTIFNSMLLALQSNQARKYFVTQVVFFKDWYDILSNAKKDSIKSLLKSGQLEIANGGWVQNDEAVCYVDDIIDQYTIGHNFLYQEFGQEVLIGWATDSFGHSHSQVAIQHILGFQMQGIQRIDERYIHQRKNGRLLEFYWSAVSDSNNRKYGGVYTHIRHFLHEFVDYRASPDMIGNDHSKVFGVMKKLYKRNKLFRFVGNDFEQFLPEEFTNLQKAMAQLNSKEKCDSYKYGNPSDYLNSIKNGEDQIVLARESDFMPNFDQDHYWSGYFTTNPELKLICKDYSRLVNLFRKVYIKYRINGGKEDDSYRKLMTKADELLAIMQHHDGITATSKYHIQQLFKKRMSIASQEIIKAITKMKGASSVICSLYNGGNKCALPLTNQRWKTMYLTILHEGAPKLQRIQLDLPPTQFYEIQQDDRDNIFCNDQEICVLVFDAHLKAGENHFRVSAVDDETKPKLAFKWNAFESYFIGNKFQIELKGNQIKYSLKNGEYIYISLVKSQGISSSVQTQTWNKFGQPIKKTERRMPGIYIMSNNGKINDIAEIQFEDLRVVEGKKVSKISATSNISSVLITVNHDQLNHIDVQVTFKPISWNSFDYFVKVDSPIKSKGVFYHDMNGYLVSRRTVGQRLDYEWHNRPDDKINANTYPMCSFVYIGEAGSRLVVFTDRAQGVTSYDDSILINIDRLAGDDYKGVGEGYSKQINNTFNFKMGLVGKDDHIERLWQRQYDQPLLGFIFDDPPTAQNQNIQLDNINSVLKYTILSLNSDEFVLRIYNLDEAKSIQVSKYSKSEWNLQEFGLNLKFQDIVQSFANGIPLSERKISKKVDEEINIFNAGLNDSQRELVLEPLQIRSFRVNLNGKIVRSSKSPSEQLPDLTSTDVKSMKTPFAKRCF